MLLGNHHDAWGYGAVDPSSATAGMMEISRVMAELYKTGSICSSLAISRQNNRLSSKFIINSKLLFNNYYLLLIINYYLPPPPPHTHTQACPGADRGGVSWGLDPLLLVRDVGFKNIGPKAGALPIFCV